jgi:hypothetical protein
MPFQPPAKLPDFARLKSTLVGARNQIKDYLLYQTILNFIDSVGRMKNILNSNIELNETSVLDLSNGNFLTHADDSLTLPNSRNLLAGTGITFDDTVANERTISSGASSSYIPMVTGAEPLEIMSDGAGHLLLVAFEL